MSFLIGPLAPFWRELGGGGVCTAEKGKEVQEQTALK